MRNRTAWILASNAGNNPSDRPVTRAILCAVGGLRIRCIHDDSGDGANGAGPVLLTDEARFDGHAAIGAFLRRLTDEIRRLESPSRPATVPRPLAVRRRHHAIAA